MDNTVDHSERKQDDQLERRAFLTTTGLAASGLAGLGTMGAVGPVHATAAEAGPGEKYSLIVCPWSAENPRHDH